MLKNAARVWGFAETEMESNFDPLVSMLLTACSVELEKISSDIHASRARVLERLVQLLSPDTIAGPLPAHGIASGTPLDQRQNLSSDTQFYVSKKFPSRNENDDPIRKEIYFTPTSDFTVNRASIGFIATGNTLYRINNSGLKEVVGECDKGMDLPQQTLWLGIGNQGVSLHDTLFYFDLKNEAHRTQFYHQLPKSQWYWNDTALGVVPGYGHRHISGEVLDLKNILERDTDVTSKLKKQINNFYRSYFVALDDPKGISATLDDNGDLGGIIELAFGEKFRKVLDKDPVRWICIDFPQAVSPYLLHELTVVMNAFPVLNRRLHSITYRLQDIVNIIPLQTEDLFLDTEDVSTDKGKSITVQNKQDNIEETAVLIRNGGVGRYDEREAAAHIEYIINILRDESAAFSAIGTDMVSSEMSQLLQGINKLEQNLLSKQIKTEHVPYLVIRTNPENQNQNLFLKYWSTCGLDANGLKPGVLLTQYRGSSFEANQIQLVTSSFGGRNKLNVKDSILAYKSALLSKERLISSEDIKSFCHYQLGQRVRSVSVEKGIMVHPDQDQGYVKTLDISIVLSTFDFDEMMKKGEMSFWKENLRQMLEERSVLFMPFRIFFTKATR